MREDSKGRRLPQWIRLYTHIFPLVRVASAEQVGAALKYAIDSIQQGNNPDTDDALVMGVYEILMDGAEHSITEYAQKIAGGHKGAENRYADRIPKGEAKDTDSIPKGEAKDTDRYLKRREAEEEQKKKDLREAEAEAEEPLPADDNFERAREALAGALIEHREDELMDIAQRERIPLTAEKVAAFKKWGDSCGWKMDGKPLRSIGAVMRDFAKRPEKYAAKGRPMEQRNYNNEELEKILLNRKQG